MNSIELYEKAVNLVHSKTRLGRDFSKQKELDEAVKKNNENAKDGAKALKDQTLCINGGLIKIAEDVLIPKDLFPVLKSTKYPEQYVIFPKKQPKKETKAEK